MKTIYLAGPYSSRDTLVTYGREAEQIGYKLGARWLDGTHEVCSDNDLERNAVLEDRQSWALDDLADVAACDVLVVFTATAAGVDPMRGQSGGRHIETGYAIGRAKRVVLVGDPENVFHWLPGVTRVADWHEALILLAAELVRYERNADRVSAS